MCVLLKFGERDAQVCYDAIEQIGARRNGDGGSGQ